MQKKDVQIGEVYAYAYHKWSTPVPVKAVDFVAEIKQGYGYSRRIVKGITVEYVGGDRKGTRLGVTGRQLLHTWEQELAIRKAQAERSARARDDRLSAAADRAAMASEIDYILASHGVEASARPVYREEDINALKARGYPFTKEGKFDQHTTKSRFYIDNFMRNGEVGADVLRVLLADSKAVAHDHR